MTASVIKLSTQNNKAIELGEAMPVDDEKLNMLVQRIYDAALDDALWPAVIREVKRLIKASDSTLYSPRLDENSKPFTLSPFEQVGIEAWTDYESYYWQHDVWVNEIIRQNLAQTGIISHGDHLIERNAFRQTVIYNDFLMPKLGRVEVVMGAVVCDASQPEQSPPMYLSFYNTTFAESFTQQDEALVRHLLPHLHRALRVRWKIAHEQQARLLREQALDCIGTAILLLDSTGRILFANQKAELLIHQGGHPTVLHGRLCSLDIAKNNAIRQALHRTQAGLGSTLRLDNGDTIGMRVLTFSPISEKSGDNLSIPARILVMISEPEKASPDDLSALASLYKLTTAETRVLKLLLQQQGTKEIAETLHVSMATLRSQLRALFAKTNTKNQRELVRFCLAHPMVG
jgi:DNA-binding CsgD family transcriptional regulator/PAS domain-containing protein